MDKASIKASMLSAISEELDLWFDKESTIEDGYQYESEFMKTAHNVNRILLSQSLGEVSSNRNKKLHTCFGKVEVNKNHVLSIHTEEFCISSKLQKSLCLLAQDCVFRGSIRAIAQVIRHRYLHQTNSAAQRALWWRIGRIG